MLKMLQQCHRWWTDLFPEPAKRLPFQSPGSAFVIEILEDRTLLSGPELLSPAAQTADTTPTYEWTAAADVERYDLLVRDLATGDQVLRENQLMTTSFTPGTPLPFGNYKAYIRAHFNDGTKSDWDSMSFSVEEPPVISISGEPGSPTPTFDWTAVPGTERYDLIIRNRETGERTVREKDLTTTSFTPGTPLPGGLYTASVRAFLDDGSKTDFDTIKFEVDGPPVLAISGAVDESTPTFEWSSLADVERYDFIIRNVETGERVIREKDLTTTSFVPGTALPDGRYRATVRAIFEDGTKSDWGTVAFSIHRPPRLMVPDDTSDPTPTFEWTEVVGAERYDLLVQNMATGDRPIRERQLTSTSFTPTTPLSDGAYTAQVRAYFPDGSKTDWDGILLIIDTTV